MRFAASTADLRNNLVARSAIATVALRRRAHLTAVTTPQYQQWFADPLAADLTLLDGTDSVDLAEPLADVPDDYCGKPDRQIPTVAPSNTTARSATRLSRVAARICSATAFDWRHRPVVRASVP